jgi:Glyoxalase/Bleomycin resistance protein/Dioxygenase superfamily
MPALPHPLIQKPLSGEHFHFQLGFVVEDLMAAAQHWVRVFGVGPFHIMPRIAAPCDYRGSTAQIDLQVGVAQAGPAQIELIQDFTAGPSVLKEIRELHGNKAFGLHQIATLVTDYESTIAHYTDNGYEVACRMTTPRQRIGYVDTFDDFGFYTEVVEETPGLKKNLAAIAKTCATWDGSDPIRILTRDGYRTPDQG